MMTYSHLFALLILAALAGSAAELAITAPTASAVSSRSPTLSGTATAGSIVEISIGGGIVAPSATAAGAGTWSWTPTTPLAEGNYTFTATVVADSATLALRLDVTPPPAPVLTPADASVLSSTVATLGFTRTRDASELASGIDARVALEFSLHRGSTLIATALLPRNSSTDTFPVTGLAEGTYSLSATASDLLGHTVTSTSTFMVDVTAPSPPTIALPASGAAVGFHPTISGSSSGAAQVEVYRNGTLLGATSATPAWWFTPTTALVSGPAALTAVALDTAGNRSAASATRSVVVTPLSVTSPRSGTSTRVNTIDLAGTAPSGRTVSINYGSVTVSVTASNGLWAYSTPLLQAEGSYTFAIATDVLSDGQTSTQVIIDTDPPTAPVISSPATGAAMSATSVRVLGSRSLDGSTYPAVTLMVDGAATGSAVSSGQANWDILLESLTEGEHRLAAVVSDLAGNTATSAAVTFSLDVTAPSAPVIVVPIAGTTVTSRRPAISGTAAAPGTASVAVYNGGALLGTTTATSAWYFTPSNNLSDGTVTLTAVGIDAAGNRSTTSAEVTFSIDATGPEVSIISPSPSPFWSTSSTVAIRASATAAAVSFRAVGLAIDDVPAGSTTSASIVAIMESGEWAGTLTLIDGGYRITAEATDEVMNTSSATVDVVVDSIAPAIPEIIAPLVNQLVKTPILEGNADALTTVLITVGGEQVGSATTSSTGYWNFALGTRPEGTTTVSVQARDRAGNLSSLVTRRFVIDRTVPPPPVFVRPGAGVSLAASSVLIEGTTEAGSTVFLDLFTSAGAFIRSGSAAAIAGTTGQPAWSIGSGPLNAGSYLLDAYTVDQAGNRSPNATREFSVDLTRPEFPVIIHPATGSYLQSLSFTATGTAPAGSTVKIFLNDRLEQTLDTTGGMWSASLAAAHPGDQVLIAQAVDAAGNTSLSASSAFIIDTGAPLITIVPARTSARAGERFGVIFYAAEKLTGFTKENVLVSGGDLIDLTPSATTGELARGQLLAKTHSSGYMVIRVPEGWAKDAAGNDSAQAAAQVEIPDGGDHDSGGSGGGCGAGGGSGIGMLLVGLAVLAGLSRRRRVQTR